MEESREAQLCAGMPEDRKEVFQRVWRRVMEGREDSCPITWENDQPALTPPSRETPPGQPALPAGAGERCRDHPQGDFPDRRAMGFLGENCRDCEPLLQEMIRREISDWKEYQLLARRTGGAPARVFLAMASDEKRHAKRLSAAYFLISGVRYWPEGENAAPPTAYLGALRRRFGVEQESMAAYLAGAEATSDPCLRQLFLEHAREEWDHACKIRNLVEQV